MDDDPAAADLEYAELVRARNAVHQCYVSARAVDYRPASIQMQALHRAEQTYRAVRERFRPEAPPVIDLRAERERETEPCPGLLARTGFVRTVNH